MVMMSTVLLIFSLKHLLNWDKIFLKVGKKKKIAFHLSWKKKKKTLQKKDLVEKKQ